ncbi:FAD-binding domain-containing protein [Alteraurantiacibacter buctensis]|uniref:Deoxyribodipyrimidine photo-lyase n=1 Tax=Alteraurantiacibacter buctensis TaxID=1503981 RepID=A0A844YXV5_9SPHN|nr:deoxyribodipyrimidine photo-lyase [Alteraurantiacibacter buctensis]
MPQPQIVWLRRDLRLADQAAFHAAARLGPVIPVYILDDETPAERRMGGASRWYLHQALSALEIELDHHELRLILRRGRADEVLGALVEETGAAGVHALRHYEPWWREAEERLAGKVDLTLHDGLYLLPPGSVVTGGGTPFKIFTPFMRALFAEIGEEEPLPVPDFSRPAKWPKSDRLEDLALLPTAPDWAEGMRQAWTAGSAAAQERFDSFLEVIDDYREDRELPSIDGSSRLSPQLHFGEVSPRQLWAQVAHNPGRGAGFFRAELAWRDYAANLVAQFPRYTEEPYRPGYDHRLWRDPLTDEEAAADLKAWQQGRTGYPIVDAGMRQLWQTGWMHNRVRMIAASFLVKHLLIDWRHGEEWFWDTLVDADHASNGTNWQWVSGTGVDSNMFVRIMAPLSQSEKFDAGDYIRHYVPELASLADPYVHDPEEAGCRPAAYPRKVIGHREARERALAAYRAISR